MTTYFNVIEGNTETNIVHLEGDLAVAAINALMGTMSTEEIEQAIDSCRFDVYEHEGSLCVSVYC